MGKKSSKKLHTKQAGYSDGKMRRKSLRQRGSSPYWYIHFVDHNLTRQKVSTGLTDVAEALVALHEFNPFNATADQKSKIRSNNKFSSSQQEIKETVRSAVTHTIQALKDGDLTGKQVRDYRESTLDSFRHAFNRFNRYCEENDQFTLIRNFKPSEAFEKFFDSFLKVIETTGTGRKMVTLRNYKRDLGNLTDLMILAGHLEQNPFRYSSNVLKTSQEEKRTYTTSYTTFTANEFAQILLQFDAKIRNMKRDRSHRYRSSLDMIQDCRDMTILSFFTGMRLGEVINTVWNDIGWDENTITVSAKPNWTPKTKESLRTIPVDSPIFWEVLQRRYSVYKSRIEHTFISIDFNGIQTVRTEPTYNEISKYVFGYWGDRRYSKDYISHKFKEIVRACFGDADPRHFHSLRHSAISIWVNDNHMVITDAMDIAGHKNLATTMGYRKRQETLKLSRYDIQVDYEPNKQE